MKSGRSWGRLGMKYELSELVDIIGGGTPKTSVSEYWNGNIPWISVKDFNNDNRYVYETEKSITQAGLDHSSTKVLSRDDIIISARGTVGELAMISKPMAFNQSCYGIRAKKSINNTFLYYLLKNSINRLKLITHGSVFDTITRDTFSQIEIDLPSLEIQKQIASILSALDDKIELNNKINENLESQAQAIFKSWFVDFEPFGGVMPEDWGIGIIEDLSKEIVCGKTPSTKKEEYYGNYIPFITIPDMHDCTYVLLTERKLSKLGANTQIKKTLPKNSICVSCIGTAGLVVLVSTESQTNQQINSIIPKSNYSPYYIFLLMQTLSEKINSLGQSGSTIVNLNKTQFGKIETLVPSIDSMNKFDFIVQPLFEKILNNQKENIQLSNFRDTLLPKLMNGEIDVSEVKI